MWFHLGDVLGDSFVRFTEEKAAWRLGGLEGQENGERALIDPVSVSQEKSLAAG